MLKLQDEKGNWYVDTAPYSLIRKDGIDMYLVPAKDETHADRLLKIAQNTTTFAIKIADLITAV